MTYSIGIDSILNLIIVYEMLQLLYIILITIQLLQICNSKIAIGFYGLSRSLSTTLGTIQRHIFDVLDANNITYDIFWSTLAVNKLTNSRSFEGGLTLNSTDYTLVNPTAFHIVSQSIIVPEQFKLYHRKQFDMFGDSFASIKNLLGAYYTMQVLNSLIQTYAINNNETYDTWLILRPDTAIITDLNYTELLHSIAASTSTSTSDNSSESSSTSTNTNDNSPTNRAIWIPDFQHWSTQKAKGWNDRGAFGPPKMMSLYLTRGTMFRDGIGPGLERFINGEQYLYKYLLYHNITVYLSSLRMVRVRADSTVAEIDRNTTHMHITNEYDIIRYTQYCLIYTDNTHINTNYKRTNNKHNNKSNKYRSIVLLNHTHC